MFESCVTGGAFCRKGAEDRKKGWKVVVVEETAEILPVEEERCACDMLMGSLPE